MLWGYGCPWFGQFPKLAEDPLYNQLELLRSWGLKGTGVGLEKIAGMGEEERENLGRYLEEHDLYLRLDIGYDYLNVSKDEAAASTARIVAALPGVSKLARTHTCMTKAGRPATRFDRSMPLEERLGRLSEAIAPLAQACWANGTPLGINNQGDFYCSDLVRICEQAEHLYIYLDTSNVHWVGEQALPAFTVAAPYVVGTHWRDEYVHPGLTKPQRLELSGAVVGEGDVPLRECYDLILEHSPFVDTMTMEIEMICPKDMDPNECIVQSLEHVRSLPVPVAKES